MWVQAPVIKRTTLLAVLSLALVPVAACTGLQQGHHVATGHRFHGMAVSSPVQMGVEADGTSFAVPLTVAWQDREGGVHEGSRPACLPAVHYRLSDDPQGRATGWG